MTHFGVAPNVLRYAAPRRARPALAGKPYGWAARIFIGLCIALFVTVALAGLPSTAILIVTALCLLTFGFVKPSVLMIAIFGVLPFSLSVVEHSDINVSGADLLAAYLTMILPIFMLKSRSFRSGITTLPVIAFLLISFLSSVLNQLNFEAIISLARMAFATISGVLIFANIDVRLSTYRKCFSIYMVAILVLATMSVITFVRGGIAASMYTLDINKNALGPTFGVGTVIAINFLITERRPRARRYIYICLCASVLGNLLSLSRGGWVATIAACWLVLLFTRRIKLLVASSILFCLIGAAVWQFLPEDASEYASNIGTQAHTIQTRFEAIEEVMGSFRSSPIYGVGVGLRKYAEPHNVIILTLGESGIMGLFFFVTMFAAGFYGFWKAARVAQNDLQAMFVVRTGACILLLTLTHGMMDVYWRRGVGFAGWACVGMAAAIAARTPSRPVPTRGPARKVPLA